MTASVIVGAIFGTPMGAYIIRPSRNSGGSMYMPYFPFIVLNVGSQQCSSYVIRPNSIVQIILGQRSVPIKVDFSSCVPVDEVVVVSVVNDTDLLSQDVYSQTLRNVGMSNPYVTFIYVASKNITSIGKTVTVTYTLLGQDGLYYD